MTTPQGLHSPCVPRSSASSSNPPTFLHIRNHFLKINQMGLVWDWEIWEWPDRLSKGLSWAPLAYKTQIMPRTHLTKVLWRLIMACKGLWRWNMLVMEINVLRRKLSSSLPSYLLSCPSCLQRALDECRSDSDLPMTFVGSQGWV